MTTPRSESTLVGSEREQVLAFVDDSRDEIARLLDGLTEEQARARLVPSETTLLGLVRHASFVEKVWFHQTVAGRTRADIGIPDHPHDSFLLAGDDTIASVTADYATARSEADDIAAGIGLDELVVHNRRGPMTLRWVYVHLVEELARHAGHGDILREQVLAVG